MSGPVAINDERFEVAVKNSVGRRKSRKTNETHQGMMPVRARTGIFWSYYARH